MKHLSVLSKNAARFIFSCSILHGPLDRMKEVAQAHTEKLNGFFFFCKIQAIEYCKDEDSKLEENCKRTFEGHDYVGMPKDHYIRLRDEIKYSEEWQALQADQLGCKQANIN